MTTISYELFNQVFEKIDNDYCKNIVFLTLQNMYHHLSDEEYKNLDTRNAIYSALKEKNMTFNDLQQELLRKTNTPYNDSDKETLLKSIENAFFKMLSRNSKHGELYKNTLDILDITPKEIFRNSLFFQEKCQDIQWLFNSLLDEDKDAIYYLAILLQNSQQCSSMNKLLQRELSNVGIDESTNIYF